MNVPTKEEIKEHLKLHKREYPRAKIAKELGISKSRLDNCLSTETMPESMALEIAKFTGMLNSAPPIEQIIPDSVISLQVPHEAFTEWEKAALKKNKTVSNWLIDEGNAKAAELLASEFGIINLPSPQPAPTKKKAHVRAAAGSESGIEADVLDWNGSSPELNVGVYGLSMLGTFDDGEVVTMTHKSKSRSPYMKKGLIYLVEMDGKKLIKEFGTRKAREDEQEAEYLTAYGMVGILISHNPNKEEYPDIDITQPLEWIAWYDGK